MIKKIILDNFQSFDHIELDLSGKGNTVKSSAFIYGENGSGKSNLINSVSFLMVSSGNLTRTMMRGIEYNDPIPDNDQVNLARHLHMIGTDDNMKLSFNFSTNGINTTYVMEYNKEGILVSESLDSIINSKMSNMFSLELGKEPVFRRGLFRGKSFVNKMRSELLQYWGRRSFISIINRTRSESNDDFIGANLHPRLLDFLRELDNIVFEQTSFLVAPENDIVLPVGKIPIEKSQELDVLESKISKFFTRLYTDITGAFFKKEEIDNKIKYDLYFRKRIAGTIREIPARLDSTGTLKLLHMLRPLLSCVDGKTVLIDDIDTWIHDLLITGMMVQIIPEINGQLIATTHNTYLMDRLSSNDVFVIGIDMDGYKRIRCVSKIERIRKNNSIRHKYYEGDFMGIPYIANLGMTDILKTGRED